MPNGMPALGIGISGLGFSSPQLPSYQPSTDYNINPQPQAGQGAYGAVPGPIGIPPNYWQQMGSIYPVAGQAGQAAGVIGKQLAGELSPETIAALQRGAAQFGVSRGMPLSDMSGRAGLLSLGQNVEATQQAGLTNYQNMLKSLSGTLTPQDLAAGIAARNALMAAAPDPRAAALQQMADWQHKFNQMQGGVARPAGGTGIYGGPPSGLPRAAPIAPSAFPTAATDQWYGPGATGTTTPYTPYSGGWTWDASAGTFVQTPTTATGIPDYSDLYLPSDAFAYGPTAATSPAGGTTYMDDLAGYYGEAPPGTVTTDTSSYYDPYADVYGMEDFSLPSDVFAYSDPYAEGGV